MLLSHLNHSWELATIHLAIHVNVRGNITPGNKYCGKKPPENLYILWQQIVTNIRGKYSPLKKTNIADCFDNWLRIDFSSKFAHHDKANWKPIKVIHVSFCNKNMKMLFLMVKDCIPLVTSWEWIWVRYFSTYCLLLAVSWQVVRKHRQVHMSVSDVFEGPPSFVSNI